MKNTMIHNLVKHLPGLKHIKSEFYRGFVLYTFLISAFLTLGAGQMWATDYQQQGTNAGWWGTGGLIFDWTKNSTTATTTLNYNGGSGTSLGEITTALKLTKTTVKFWRTNGSGNICSSTIWWELFKGSTSIESGSFSPATWGSWSGSNNSMTSSSAIDFFAKTNGPGDYTIKVYAKLTGGATSSSSCSDNFWYNNNNSGTYSITFTIPSKNLTVSARAGGSASGSKTGITKGTAYTITATPNSGYTFSGWSATSGSSSITIANTSSATTTVTFNNYSNNATITASFAAETTHDVTISYRCTSPSKSIRDNAVQAIGVTTHSVVTAPDITGYTFSGWTVGNGLNNYTGNTTTNPIEVTTKASGTYTLQANYTEYLSSTCTLHGGFDDWGSGLAMTKKSGASTSDWVYATVSLTGSTTQTPFKVVDGSNWYGKASTNITKTLGSLTKSITGLTIGGYDETNLYLQHLVTGSYEIGYNMSTHEFKVTWPDVNQIQITSGDASSPTPAGYYDFDEVSGTVYSKEFTFSKNKRYSAKIIYHSDFYAFNNTSDMTISNHTSWRLYDTANGANICNVYSPVAGRYTYQFNSNDGGETKLTVVYPTAYTITFGAGTINGSNSAISVTADPTFSSGDYVLKTTAVTFKKGTTKAGYVWKGWYSNANGSGTLHSSTNANWTSAASTRTGNISVYACYNYATYTVTLQNSGETGYGGGTASRNITATYNTAMPAMGAAPTAANGYAFMGYYDGHNGAGTKYYNADGSSAHVWDKTSAATLYAYFKKAELSVTLSPATTVAPSTSMTATATISPTPTGTTITCWKLLRSNGTLYSDDCFTPASGNSVTFTAPESGSYKVATILRLGSSCGAGEVVDSVVTNLVIATDHTVTVKYMCGDDVIKEQTTATGKPLEWTSITAPTIVGYTFSKWRAGDAVTIEGADANGEKASATINYKANYDGKLTAIYTKKRVIYFNNTLGWSSVAVYFYDSDKYWGTGSDANKGTGSLSTWKASDNSYPFKKGGAMTQIEGTNIWYYDCEANSVSASYTNVAFTEGYKANYTYFTGKVVRRSDYSANTLPMFVPLTGVDPTSMNTGVAQYYNEGYWMNYPENTGYWLKVFDAKNDGNELYSIPFEFTADKTLPMEISINLEAKKTYYYQVYRADGVYISVDGTMKSNDSGDTEKGQSPWTIFGSRPRTGLITTAAGDYTFILGYANSGGYNYIMSVKYPAKVNDYRLVYTDLATADFWSQNAAHTSSWFHPSRVIEKKENAIDTISFFIAKGQTPKIKVQQINSITEGTGVVSWTNVGDWSDTYDSVSAAGVYNFIIQQDGSGSLTLSSITKVEPYTGDYYIRVDAASNKWVNYTTDHDHLMTYTEFSENRSTNTFGPLYSHYKAKWCVRGTNVKFVIANDYSPCISDTLTKDKPNTFDNIDDYGNLKTSGGDATSDKYSANIRFMWNRHTNKIGRAYVASATTPARQFLVLKSCTEIRNSDGSELNGTGESHAANDYRAIFKDNQDFIYERMITIQPGTRAKLYACYAYDPYNVSKAQFFRGEYDNGDCEDADNSIQIIGGSGSDFYTVRLIYDFKTNRLICAWLPDGTIINSNVEIDADVMVIRDHQESAECITFSGSGKLSEVKTVYGVLRLNRWTLNNRARGLDGEDDQNPEHCSTASAISTYHPVLATGDQKSLYERALYFISFPFDVKLSEVFGFGTYGVDWVISEYNGLRRAKNGYFYDNCFNDDCTNWDYIWDRTGVTLEAYKGYLLSLEIDNMAYDNTDFWPNNISQKELYFPSASAMSTITTTNVTMPGLGDEYECKINYNKPEGSNPEGDRRMKDSYWRCIGTPSYATYGTILKKDGPSGSTIEWQSDRSWRATVKNFPFLYEWNVDDNSISVQATTRYNFKPTHAYLVQNGNAIYWTAVSATPSSIVRRQREEEDQEYYWRLTLEQDGVFQDQTYIRMTDNEQVTDTFDFGQDLAKESKVGYSNVYTVLGYERLAANSMPLHTENTTIIPLGVKALTAGEFTFDLPDGANGVGITLVDNETGEHTNLSTGMSYTIALGQGTYENRFYLEIAKIKDVATGTEEIGEPSKSDVRKVMIDGILYIVRGDQIFDARGNRVE